MKKFEVEINDKKIIIYQDDDNKFIKPQTIKKYESLGTALKPANEPIVLARKPISEKTIADNVLKWGTGGINIDGCRVGNEIIKINQVDLTNAHGNNLGAGVKQPFTGEVKEVQGRFPANVIFDEEAGARVS